MAINFAGLFVHRRVTHWVSIHGSMFPDYLGLRAQIRRPIDKRSPRILTHALNPQEGVDYAWRDTVGLDSGLYGVRIALLLGYDQIVLAGIPNDATGHFYEDPRTARSMVTSAAVWKRFAPEMAGRVTSLSGWTADLLGAPGWI